MRRRSAVCFDALPSREKDEMKTRRVKLKARWYVSIKIIKVLPVDRIACVRKPVKLKRRKFIYEFSARFCGENLKRKKKRIEKESRSWCKMSDMSERRSILLWQVVRSLFFISSLCFARVFPWDETSETRKEFSASRKKRGRKSTNEENLTENFCYLTEHEIINRKGCAQISRSFQPFRY